MVLKRKLLLIHLLMVRLRDITKTLTFKVILNKFKVE